MQRKFRAIFLSTLFLIESNFFQSCCYQFGYGELASQYSTISIPYAEGDPDGNLTSEVIRKISTAGVWRYVNCEGDLLLKIKVISVEDQNIGYRYDRKRDEKLKHSIIPTESRFTATAEIALVDAVKNEVLKGPALVTATLDFDYDYYKIQHSANVFSLGQLNDIDSARDAARHPLDAKLAERIAEYILNAW